MGSFVPAILIHDRGERRGDWRGGGRQEGGGLASGRQELIALMDMPICKLVTSTIA